MPELDLSQPAQQWVNIVLIWLGFGIVAGLLARALVPGRQPAGAVATLFVGVLGSAIGLFVLGLLLGGREFNPISPVGMLAATAGAFAVLVLHRIVVAVRAMVPKDPDPPQPADGR